MTSTKFYSNIQETTIARFLGWHVTSGSGSRPYHQGDIYSENWLGECKTHVTPNDKIVIHKKVWDKIQSEAQSNFKYPVLFVDDGHQSTDHTWCVFPYIAVVLHQVSRHLVNSVHVNNSSLRLSHSELSAEYNSCFQNNLLGVCVVSWHGQMIAICPLSVFSELFGER